MNREIKFRGKALNGEKWYYGSLIDYEAPAFCDIVRFNEDNEAIHEYIDINTVGQFTGLYDKNGKEIYEGDIVKCNDKNYVVNFKYGMFYASVEECNKGIYGGFPLYFILDKNEECEVIGNIYDNPELLKGGEK